jgi:hypothetical protein
LKRRLPILTFETLEKALFASVFAILREPTRALSRQYINKGVAGTFRLNDRRPKEPSVGAKR